MSINSTITEAIIGAQIDSTELVIKYAKEAIAHDVTFDQFIKVMEDVVSDTKRDVEFLKTRASIGDNN